jgi:hypothetical protein
VPADPIGDDNPIEWILLTGFPNPERNGCPPPETIQALGERKIGRDDPAWQHIWHCSPCFRDFKTIRDRRLAAQEEAEQRAKRKRQIFVSVGSALAAACLVMILVFSGSRIKNLRGTAIVPIDLTNAATFRGASEDDGGRLLATLPQRLDELDITLPQYSPEGRYILAILKSKTESTAIVLGSGSSKISNGKNMLIVTLDLSAAKPGRYFLATRKEEQGQEEEAYYYPVLITGT